MILADEAFGLTAGNFIDTYWSLADHQGSVTTLVTHNAGTTSVAQRLAYTAFGSIGSVKDGQGNNVTTGPISRFAYTGREFDRETGDYYYRARYFDPQTGRFLSQDPIGFAAGDMNLYRYVGNSTPNFTDPTGLYASGYVSNVPTNPGPRPPVSSTMGAGPQGLISGYTPSNPFGNDNLPTMTTNGFGDPLPIDIPEPNPIGIVTPIPWDPTPQGGASTDPPFPTSPPGTFPGQTDRSIHPIPCTPKWITNLPYQLATGGVISRFIVCLRGSGWVTSTATRSTPGRDGGISEIIKYIGPDGRTAMIIHKVTVNGKIIHQHATCICKYGGQRPFPDVWTGIPTIGK
jgi:RHS repeat-associated protein